MSNKFITACCVEGCGNTFSSTPSSTNEKNANRQTAHPISFYRFPRRKELKQKWLTAIGRPNWDVPSAAHVCSVHFSPLQVEYLNGKIYQIKDDGCPDNALPISKVAEVDATQLMVCRFCLATNVKMFSLQSGVLKTCLESFIGLHKNHDVDGLPQYLCYVCATYLLKMYNLIKKSMIAQATLLDIYAENLKITQNLVFKQNREKLNLLYTLQSHKTTPCKVYDYVYDDKLGVSVLVKDKSNIDIKEDNITMKESSSGDMSDSDLELRAKHLNKLCKKLKQNINESEDLLTDIYNEPFVVDHTFETYHGFTHSKQNNKLRNIKDVVEHYKDMNTIDGDTDDRSIACEYIVLDSSDSEVDNIKTKKKSGISVKDHDYLHVYTGEKKLRTEEPNDVKLESRNVQERKNKKHVQFSNSDNIKITGIKRQISQVETVETRNPKNDIETKNNHDSSKQNDIPFIEYYYNIVELTLDEQKKQWVKSTEQPSPAKKDANQCNICSKWVRRGPQYQNHVARHDPAAGVFGCEVCKVRFDHEYQLNRHISLAHAKSFYCKSCPAVFYNMTAARYHRSKHETRSPECEECGRRFSSLAGLRAHFNARHRNAPPTIPRPKYSCKTCNLSFASNRALGEHMATTCPDRKSTPSLLEASGAGSMLCTECGVRVASRDLLLAHRRSVHAGQRAQGAQIISVPDRSDKITVTSVEQWSVSQQDSWKGEDTVVLRNDEDKLEKDAPTMSVSSLDQSSPLHEPRAPVRQYARKRVTRVTDTIPSTVNKEKPKKNLQMVHIHSLDSPPDSCKAVKKDRGDKESDVAHECPICDSAFKSTDSLNEHILKVHQPKQFAELEEKKEEEIEYLLLEVERLPMKPEYVKESVEERNSEADTHYEGSDASGDEEMFAEGEQDGEEDHEGYDKLEFLEIDEFEDEYVKSLL